MNNGERVVINPLRTGQMQGGGTAGRNDLKWNRRNRSVIDSGIDYTSLISGMQTGNDQNHLDLWGSNNSSSRQWQIHCLKKNAEQSFLGAPAVYFLRQNFHRK